MNEDPKEMDFSALLDEYIPMSLRWTGGGNIDKAYALDDVEFERYIQLGTELSLRCPPK